MGTGIIPSNLSLHDHFIPGRTLGRPEEALAEAQQIDTYYLPEIVDIFRKQGYEEMALRLQKGFKKSTNTSHTQE
jgi:hypothetical protein